MRSLLLVPMEPRAIEAALSSEADALVLDLASVARDAAARDDARLAARDLLRALHLGTHRPHLYLRLAGLDDAAFDRDLAAIMGAEPDGILLAGSRSGADVQHLGAKLAVQEAEHGFADGETAIIAEAGAEARSLFALGGYPGVSDRLVGLSWHAEALAHDLGSRRGPPEPGAPSPFDTARHLILFAARAAEVAAIDSPSPAATADAFLAECRAARRHGFNAKLATEPAQCPLINAVFGFEGDDAAMD